MERRLGANWREINLSDNFTLGEFVVSKEFPELIEDIFPTIDQVNNLYKLCQFALQPIRDKFGPVDIHSGLRSIALNDALHGEKDSQHLYGEAADFTISKLPMLDVYAFCIHDLHWAGEVIYYQQKGHCHIALKTLWNRPDQFIKEE